jgi:hypothetical protein
MGEGEEILGLSEVSWVKAEGWQTKVVALLTVSFFKQFWDN